MSDKEWLQALAEVEDALREDPPALTVAPGPDRLRAVAAVLRGRLRHSAAPEEDRAEFLGTVAHDLRTPLVAILGFVQLLQRSAERFGLADKQEEYVVRIQQAAQQMNRLMEDLRVARHLEEGRLTLRPVAVELVRFLDEVLSFQREAARQRGLVLESRFEPGHPRMAVFDPDRIAQALGNLLQNAVRITPSNGQVEVGVSAVGGRLVFRVRDSGPGIEPEAVAQLFNRSSKGRGSGLGLFICREVAALHGGGVTVRSPPGGGAEFSLELPLVTVPDEANPELSS